EDQANYIPEPVDEALVTAHLQKYRPADVNVIEAHAPDVDLFSPTIKLQPNDDAAKGAASAAIHEYLRGLDAGGTLVLSHLSAMLAASEEIDDHEIVSPAANVTATSLDHVFFLESPI